MSEDAAHDGTRTLFVAGGGIFDGTGDQLRPGQGVLVEGAQVVAVGPAASLTTPGVRVCDLGDAVLLPGFVDAHTHITIRPGEGDQHAQLGRSAAWQTIRGIQNVDRMLRSGVTTARIMTEEFDIDFEFRDAIERGEIHGPRLFVSGPGLSPPGGHGSAQGGVAGVEPLRMAVRSRAARGADHIKIFTTGGVSSTGTSLQDSNYSGAEIAAIVDEAARAGLTVSAHAHGGQGVELAVANGIHSIEHGALLSAENLEQMRQAGTFLVLTNTILFHPTGIEQGDARAVAIMEKVQQARTSMAANAPRVRASGIPIALGTDSMHGLFGYELQWLVEHGWTPAQALIAATSGGGALLRDDKIGVLRPGSWADFVVLARNPFEDITAVFDVLAVYRNGTQVTGAESAYH